MLGFSLTKMTFFDYLSLPIMDIKFFFLDQKSWLQREDN